MERNYIGEDGAMAPALRMFAIVPSDGVALTILPKAIRCDVDGVVVLKPVGSDTDVTLNMAAGEILPVRAEYVKTGTTATVHGLA